jgi:hypothetical protein
LSWVSTSSNNRRRTFFACSEEAIAFLLIAHPAWQVKRKTQSIGS